MVTKLNLNDYYNIIENSDTLVLNEHVDKILSFILDNIIEYNKNEVKDIINSLVYLKTEMLIKTKISNNLLPTNTNNDIRKTFIDENGCASISDIKYIKK